MTRSQKISVVQQRLVSEYGYDEHSAKEALATSPRSSPGVSGVSEKVYQ